MFRKNPYKEVAKRIRRKSEIGDLEIKEFQIITIRPEIDSSPKIRTSNLDQIDSLDSNQIL